jgi:hypothetical protein
MKAFALNGVSAHLIYCKREGHQICRSTTSHHADRKKDEIPFRISERNRDEEIAAEVLRSRTSVAGNPVFLTFADLSHDS